ncbi:hypothetical protein CHLRE_03g146787v5 [Chlamydomonas reinhardtii]|uniref:Uncharacterized protein n=1 Tax=Chlamydomonas reinhardtii TaxID=3055 RepID=A0A2K3DVH1_CHLRE|nr:uncharacterized protein CHLRE_03g146787v5 [Chlamydomonas reinhardtii]PNW84537.1 hypothetical protein CHLRE_03g146787v5 [Chlamydomonas reinhardtii]
MSASIWTGGAGTPVQRRCRASAASRCRDRTSARHAAPLALLPLLALFLLLLPALALAARRMHTLWVPSTFSSSPSSTSPAAGVTIHTGGPFANRHNRHGHQPLLSSRGFNTGDAAENSPHRVRSRPAAAASPPDLIVPSSPIVPSNPAPSYPAPPSPAVVPRYPVVPSHPPPSYPVTPPSYATPQPYPVVHSHRRPPSYPPAPGNNSAPPYPPGVPSYPAYPLPPSPEPPAPAAP